MNSFRPLVELGDNLYLGRSTVWKTWASIMVKTKGDAEQNTEEREREREKPSSGNLETKDKYSIILGKDAIPRLFYRSIDNLGRPDSSGPHWLN